MFPPVNSFPFHSNAAPSSAPQVMVNQGNFAPNLMQHPEMGMPNPQTPIPFSTSNALFVPNQFFHMQGPQNLNNPIAMSQLNNMNTPNPVAQFFNQNSLNPSQFLNQNLNFGLGFPIQMQNMNQIFQMQMPNLNPQAVAANFNLPQNLAFGASNQLGFANGSGTLQHPLNRMPNASQKLQAVQAFAPFPPQLNTNNFHPPPPKSQGNNRNPTWNHKINNSGKNHRNKNFSRNPKHEVSRDRFAKSQIHNFQNTKGNFRSHCMQSRKGNDNDDGSNTFFANSAKQIQVVKKRSISLNYTEQEIRQWCEERRKNYPSKANMEKKLAEKLKEPGTADLVAKRRRQQLKEILAKQAELGCEVAEIPECYLSDSEKQVHEMKDNGRALSKREKFQNKFNKRGRFNKDGRFSKKNSVNCATSGTYNQNDHLAKKQRLANDDSVIHHAPSKRAPSLLQKLLSADIRRDKRHLLQVFRFMVTNSFFKDWPEQPLKYPLVVVKETGKEDVLIKGKSKDISEGILQETEESTDSDHDDNENKKKAVADVQAGKHSTLERGFREESVEEEGEIID